MASDTQSNRLLMGTQEPCRDPHMKTETQTTMWTQHVDIHTCTDMERHTKRAFDRQPPPTHTLIQKNPHHQTHTTRHKQAHTELQLTHYYEPKNHSIWLHNNMNAL